MENKAEKELKILAVCGMGLGSGLVLKMTIEKVLKDLNIKARVSVADVVSAKSEKADLIVTSSEFEGSFRGSGLKVITVKNYVDANEMKEKIKSALEDL